MANMPIPFLFFVHRFVYIYCCVVLLSMALNHTRRFTGASLFPDKVLSRLLTLRRATIYPQLHDAMNYFSRVKKTCKSFNCKSLMLALLMHLKHA